MATTWLARRRSSAGSRGSKVVVSSPPGYELEDAAGGIRRVADPTEAVAGAQAVYTDVWVSMGDEETADPAPRQLLDPVPDRRGPAGRRGAPTQIALHCLPAHPGEEITEDVLYGERQRIWDQAENRRHAQKALLELLFAS